VDVIAADTRKDALCKWIDQSTPYDSTSIKIASADASFRRYFRIHTQDGSLIAMDAPPELEPSKPFVDLAQTLAKKGVQVPKVHYQNIEEGFLLLSDFGDTHYQDVLFSEQRNHLYELAVQEIIKFQKLESEIIENLPLFDPAWQIKELEIFREWCLPELAPSDFAKYTETLIQGVDQIPKSFMHRDFHCRNLLLLPDGTPGIIDFQGAMLGPITYDLVSLFRDCYVENSEEWIDRMVAQFRTQLIQSGLIDPSISSSTMKKWFDWAGLQRHLKCVGIFHRLQTRDGKPEYLQDIPRVLGYVNRVLQNYPELSDLFALVEQANLLEPASSL
jgi:aminoglycoside/choline kinase family phosphotransferase